MVYLYRKIDCNVFISLLPMFYWDSSIIYAYLYNETEYLYLQSYVLSIVFLGLVLYLHLQSYLFRGKVTRIASRRICLDNRKIYIRILGTC